MKKTFAIMLAAALGLVIFSGCEEDSKVNETPNEGQNQEQTIATLEGSWVGYFEGESAEKCHYTFEATITKTAIEIKRKPDPLSLVEHDIVWWYGTYLNPEGSTSSYSWESVADQNKISKPDLNAGEDPINTGSLNDRKEFTYSQNKLRCLEFSDREYDPIPNPYIYFEKVN